MLSKHIGLPWCLSSKESACKAGDRGDTGSISWWGRSPGGKHGIPLWYSCQQNPMDRGAWQAIVHEVAKRRIQLKGLSTHTIYIFIFPFLNIPNTKFFHNGFVDT